MQGEPSSPRPRTPTASVFKQAVDAEKHVFDFASFIFRITAWWTAFAFILNAALTTHVNVEADTGWIPFDLNLDISIPAMVLTGLGLVLFALYGFFMIARLWVILVKVRDSRFPPGTHGRAMRTLLSIAAFAIANVAILFCALLVLNALKRL